MHGLRLAGCAPPGTKSVKIRARCIILGNKILVVVGRGFVARRSHDPQSPGRAFYFRVPIFKLVCLLNEKFIFLQLK